MATKKKRTAAAAKASGYRATLARRFKGDLMLGTMFAEMFGTFALTAMVLATNGSNALLTMFTIVALVLALFKLSGSHLNPAITIAMVATKQMAPLRGLGYIVSQFLGAMLAFVAVNAFVTSAPADATTGQVAEMFKTAALTGDAWRPFFAEALGAMVFGFGVASAVMYKKDALDAAWTIGAAVFVGLLLATMASAAILNPAVALGVSAYNTENWATVGVYALGPIVGMTAGAWLCKLLMWDTAGRK